MKYDEDFFKVLFDSLPVIALVLDQERRVHLVNRTVKLMFGYDDAAVYLKQGGDLFKCIFASRDSRGCGYAPQCEKCVPRNTALQAISGRAVKRAKGDVTIHTAKGIRFHNLLITAAPIKVTKSNMALMIIEDVSNITQLNGMLPICSSCKKIRSEENEWIHFEQYIENHSEAQFTHDCCPDCIKRLYRR